MGIDVIKKNISDSKLLFLILFFCLLPLYNQILIEPQEIENNNSIIPISSDDDDFFLTVISEHGEPIGGGWYEEESYAYVSLTSPIVEGGYGERYIFASWGEDGSGINYAESNPIYMDRDRFVVVNWVSEFYLRVDTNVKVESNGGWYEANTIAIAAVDQNIVYSDENLTRYTFSHWSGDSSGNNYTQSNNILMDGPKTAIVNWTTEHYLEIITNYSTAQTQGWYEENSTAFAAVSSEYVYSEVGTTNGSRFAFEMWTGDAIGNLYWRSEDVVMDSPKSITAHWNIQYLLTIESENCAISSNQGWYDAGANISASCFNEMIPGTNGTRYVFDKWKGDVNGTYYAASSQISMTSPKTAIVQWKTQYLLSFSTHPTILPQSLSIHPDFEWYDENLTINLSARIVSGYNFQKWVIDGTTEIYNSTLHLHMTGPHSVIAHYVSIEKETPFWTPLRIGVATIGVTVFIGWAISIDKRKIGDGPMEPLL